MIDHFTSLCLKLQSIFPCIQNSKCIFTQLLTTHWFSVVLDFCWQFLCWPHYGLVSPYPMGPAVCSFSFGTHIYEICLAELISVVNSILSMIYVTVLFSISSFSSDCFKCCVLYCLMTTKFTCPLNVQWTYVLLSSYFVNY